MKGTGFRRNVKFFNNYRVLFNTYGTSLPAAGTVQRESTGFCLAEIYHGSRTICLHHIFRLD